MLSLSEKLDLRCEILCEIETQIKDVENDLCDNKKLLSEINDGKKPIFMKEQVEKYIEYFVEKRFYLKKIADAIYHNEI